MLTGFSLDTFFHGSGGSERGDISEIRELTNLDMPQLNEALSLNPASSQVMTAASCGVLIKCVFVFLVSVHYSVIVKGELER